MGQYSLIYSFVARGTVVLAEYRLFDGNFSKLAVDCLESLSAIDSRYEYRGDHHTFNYLVNGGFTYLLVADEDFGQEMSFAFLERVKEDFMARYGSGKADTATAHSLDKDFGPRLKEHMAYCIEHPEELSKLSKIKSQVEQVKGVMMENIEKVLKRGVVLDVLKDQSEDLRVQTKAYQQKTRDLRRKMCMQNMRLKLFVLIFLIVVGIIIWLSVCKGFKC